MELDTGTAVTKKVSKKSQKTAGDKKFVFQFPEKYLMLDGVKGAGEIKVDSMSIIARIHISLYTVHHIHNTVSGATVGEISKVNRRE